MDGSPHAWLEQRGPRCTLLAFNDDASGRLQYTRFAPTETARAYPQGLRAYVARFGRTAIRGSATSTAPTDGPSSTEPVPDEVNSLVSIRPVS